MTSAPGGESGRGVAHLFFLSETRNSAGEIGHFNEPRNAMKSTLLLNQYRQQNLKMMSCTPYRTQSWIREICTSKHRDHAWQLLSLAHSHTMQRQGPFPNTTLFLPPPPPFSARCGSPGSDASALVTASSTLHPLWRLRALSSKATSPAPAAGVCVCVCVCVPGVSVSRSLISHSLGYVFGPLFTSPACPSLARLAPFHICHLTAA